MVIVDIFCGSEQQHRIVCAYFSPTGSSPALTQRMSALCEDLEAVMQCECPVVIAGDFNLPEIRWDNPIHIGGENSKEYIFVSFCIANGLSQLIDEPTRPQSGSILDLLLTNQRDSIINPKVCPSPVKTDHLTVYFQISVPKAEVENESKLNFRKSDFDAISVNLVYTNWYAFLKPFDSADAMFMSFVNYMTMLLTIFTPERSSSSPVASFIGRITRKISFERNPDHHQRLSRKLERAAIRERFLKEVALDIKDAASFFRYANMRLHTRSGVSPLQLGSNVIVDDQQKANALRRYFESVYTVPTGISPIFTPQTTNVLNDIEFTPDLVYKKLKNLKAKVCMTPESISSLAYKELALFLAEPLSIIFTRSFEEAEVPSLFREAVVTPVFKKGASSNPENYRPIAQESIPCILMESIIVDAIYNHLQSNSLLDANQHGFTKGRSTGTQLFEVAYDWAVAKNHGNALHCVYFDFSRAFDRVDHCLLLNKMSALGLGPRIINWCRSYLQNRKFRVKVGNRLSEEASAPSGVPQGSSLGPLMYTIFAQDLKLVLNDSYVKYKIYADDLKLYCEVRSVADSFRLQAAIDLVNKWSLENRMTISIPKCAVLKTKSDNCVYTLAGSVIPEVSTYKDLGVTFDVDLSFRVHMAEVAKSAARWCNLILRCFIIKDASFYIRLYETLVVPKLGYCIHVWCPFRKKDLLIFQAVQDRFLKRVAWRCNVKRETLSLPTIEELCSKADLRLFSQLVSSDSLHNFFLVQGNHLRSSICLRAKEIANCDAVNNSFVWRIEKQFRDDQNFYKTINPLK